MSIRYTTKVSNPHMDDLLVPFRDIALALGEDESTDFDLHAGSLWCRNVAVQVDVDTPTTLTFHIQIHEEDGTPFGVFPDLDAESARVLWSALLNTSDVDIENARKTGVDA